MSTLLDAGASNDKLLVRTLQQEGHVLLVKYAVCDRDFTSFVECFGSSCTSDLAAHTSQGALAIPM